MKLMTVALIAVVAGGCSVRTNINRTGNDEAEIRSLDAGWARSYAVHDTAYAYQLFSDDFVMTATNGAIKDRAAEMADIRPAPNLKMDFFRTSNVNVRTYNGAAVVTGLAEWSFTFNGQPRQVSRRYTATYARGGPLGWRMVALHIGQAPPPKSN